jgi:hypothetical protein
VSDPIIPIVAEVAAAEHLNGNTRLAWAAQLEALRGGSSHRYLLVAVLQLELPLPANFSSSFRVLAVLVPASMQGSESRLVTHREIHFRVGGVTQKAHPLTSTSERVCLVVVAFKWILERLSLMGRRGQFPVLAGLVQGLVFKLRWGLLCLVLGQPVRSLVQAAADERACAISTTPSCRGGLFCPSLNLFRRYCVL